MREAGSSQASQFEEDAPFQGPWTGFAGKWLVLAKSILIGRWLGLTRQDRATPQMDEKLRAWWRITCQGKLRVPARGRWETSVDATQVLAETGQGVTALTQDKVTDQIAL